MKDLLKIHYKIGVPLVSSEHSIINFLEEINCYTMAFSVEGTK